MAQSVELPRARQKVSQPVHPTLSHLACTLLICFFDPQTTILHIRLHHPQPRHRLIPFSLFIRRRRRFRRFPHIPLRRPSLVEPLFRA